MWRNTCPLEDSALKQFENHFSFQIEPVLRQFLLTHNGGSPNGAEFPTEKKIRKLCWLFDFSNRNDQDGAWCVNEHLRRWLGPERIAIGRDHDMNYIIVERDRSDRRRQRITVWIGVTMEFECCAVDIHTFTRIVS